MVKAKPWTPATLKQVGGMGGLGVAFLEAMFWSSECKSGTSRPSESGTSRSQGLASGTRDRLEKVICARHQETVGSFGIWAPAKGF